MISQPENLFSRCYVGLLTGLNNGGLEVEDGRTQGMVVLVEREAVGLGTLVLVTRHRAHHRHSWKPYLDKKYQFLVHANL